MAGNEAVSNEDCFGRFWRPRNDYCFIYQFVKKFLKIFKRIWVPLYGILFVLLVIFSISAAKFQLERKDKMRSQISNISARNGQVTGIATVNQNSSQQPVTSNQKSESTSAVSISSGKQKTVSREQATTTATQTPTNPPVVKDVELVYLKVNSGSAAGYYQDDFISGENAFSLMQRMAGKYNFTIKFTDYGGSLGKYIDCIGGLCRDNNYIPGIPYYSWMLYYNGAMSSVGASSLVVKKNDIVEWRFETY